MQNQLYSISMGDRKTLEIYICDTNELNPYRKTKEIGVVLLGKEMQFDGQLDFGEITSLITYLKKSKAYIKKYNKSTQPKSKFRNFISQLFKK